MRYPPEHKEKARSRLLAASARHAKKHGFASSGMDALAAAAEVTTGSLYKHFAGKGDLFAAVVDAELQKTAKRFAAIDPGDRTAALRALDAYVSPKHVAHPEAGCPLPSLAAEIARAEPAVRDAYQRGLLAIQAVIAERMTGSAERAWALIAQSVGAVLLARALPDAHERSELLTAVARQCAMLLGTPATADGEPVACGSRAVEPGSGSATAAASEFAAVPRRKVDDPEG